MLNKNRNLILVIIDRVKEKTSAHASSSHNISILHVQRGYFQQVQKSLPFGWGNSIQKSYVKPLFNSFLCARHPSPSFIALPYVRMWIWHTQRMENILQRGLVFNLSLLLPYSTFMIIIRSHRISSSLKVLCQGEKKYSVLSFCSQMQSGKILSHTNTHPSPQTLCYIKALLHSFREREVRRENCATTGGTHNDLVSQQPHTG